MIKSTISNLEDIATTEQTPLDQRLLATNTYELIKQSADRVPDNIALRFLPSGDPEETPLEWSYATFFSQINKTANVFHRLGLKPDGVVSMLLPNLPQTHLTIWAGETTGIVNCVNPMLETGVISDILNEVDSKILVALGPIPGTDIWQKVEEVVSKVPTLSCVLRVDPGAALGFPILPALEESANIGGIPLLDFDQEMAKENGNQLLSNRSISPQDIASYFHTGGTTGKPKIAQHTHLNEVANTAMIRDLYKEDINFFVGLPLFHVNAVIATGLGVFSKGGCVTLLTAQGYRHPNMMKNFWALVDRYRATQFSCVPTVLTTLLNVPVGDCDISSLDFCVCGAAPLSTALTEEFENTFNLTLVEGYGLTEGSCVSSLNPMNDQRRTGSIGLRLPYQQMKCVQIDAQGKYVRDCDVDEPGVIAIKGANVISGYKQAAMNQTLFVAEGWLNTGDLARQDADGFFWLTGRAKDLIIRGGHNIDPSTIESCLSAHAAVAQVAALGQPDSYAGELPCAYVSLKPGMAVTAEELRQYANEQIQERAAIPVYIEIMEALPLTAIGKIFKPEMRRMATERVLTKTLADENIEATLSTRIDEKYGLVADIKAPENRHEGIKTVLGRFTVHLEMSY